jgi:SAM-dependent methyltransferase
VREALLEVLCCPSCRGRLELEAWEKVGPAVQEGALRCACGGRWPIVKGVPRLLPAGLMVEVASRHADFFRRHPELQPTAAGEAPPVTRRTLASFGDEWTRFPELFPEHERIFEWYFEGPAPVPWAGLRVLDAGCGMGRWLHFAAARGASVVGLDLSAAIDVAAARGGDEAEFVQADLRSPPLADGSFDLVYSLGVLHHLEDPRPGVRALARLVRPGGELRLYVYRTLDDEPWFRRALLGAVSQIRKATTRVPFSALHAFSAMVSAVATGAFLLPRRALRRWAWGERLTRGLPLVHYQDVPFRMLVAEQFDRFSAPLEGRHRREEVESWLRDAGLQVTAVLPGLGWRAVARSVPPAA